MWKITLLGTTLLLTGCAGFQETCSNYGFTPGTNDFANCMQRLDDDNRRAWSAMGNYRIQPLPQPQPVQLYYPQTPQYDYHRPLPQPIQTYQPRQQLNCTTSNIGTMSYTNCN